MRIFISFFSCFKNTINDEARIPCFYDAFIKELKKYGNELQVYITDVFGREFQEIPHDLLKSLEKFSPELCIFFNNNFYDISRLFECPIVIYEADSSLFYSNKDALKRNISRYKFVVNYKENADHLINFFGVNKKCILACPPFTSVNAEKKDIKSNIVFIGSKFYENNHKSIYSDFMLKSPSIDKKNQFKKLFNIFSKNPFISDTELESIFEKDFIAKYSKYRTVFLQSISDYRRVKTLSCIADLGLNLYGDKLWITDTYNEPEVIMSYVDKDVYSLKDNQDIYNSSKIGININHVQAMSGYSWRVLDILASNSCLVTDYSSTLDPFFKLNVPFFSNPCEARDCCKRILSNENLRNDIINKCHELIDKDYRFNNIKEKLECFLNIKLEGSYSGETVYYQSIFKRKEFRNISF